MRAETASIFDGSLVVIKLIVLALVLCFGLSTMNDLSELPSGLASEPELDRLLDRGAWVIGLALAFLLNSLRALTLRPSAQLRFKVLAVLLGLGAMIVFATRDFARPSYDKLAHALTAVDPKGAWALARFADAGELGWVDHADLWPHAAPTHQLGQRVARANLVLLLLDGRWEPARRAAEADARTLVNRRTRALVQQTVSEVEAHARPFRQPYAEYEAGRAKARTAIAQCERKVEDGSRSVRSGDKPALRSFLQKSDASELDAFDREQAREYYRHGKTVVRGRDLPLFLDHRQFVAFWEPHLQRRGASAGFMRERAMQQVNQRWHEYSSANAQLTQRIDAQVVRLREQCRQAASQPFVAQGLTLELDPAAFVLAKAPTEQKRAVARGLASVLDKARPEYGLQVLRVRDLPILEDEDAVNERLRERVNTVHAHLQGERPTPPAQLQQRATRATLGRSALLAALSLAVLTSAGVLLGVLLQLGLAPWLDARDQRLSRLSEVVAPFALLAAFSLGNGPFEPGGDMAASLSALAHGARGNAGRLHAIAIRTEPAGLFFGSLLCRLPVLRCSSNK